MGIIKLNWLPEECAYCDNPIECEIIHQKFLGRTSVCVCKECAKEIWQEQTNRRLP